MAALHGTKRGISDSADPLTNDRIKEFRKKAIDSMSIEETEINVGGVSFKGVYIAVFLTAIGTVSGGVWAASEFYSRVGAIEAGLDETANSIPDTSPIVERLSVIENSLNDMTIPDISSLENNMASSMEAINTIKLDIARLDIPDLSDLEIKVEGIEVQLRDNNIGQLQGQLAELSTSLANMMEQVRTLTELRDQVATARQEVSDGNAKIVTMDVQVNSALRFARDVERLQKEVDDLWNGMDALANPLN